VQAEACIHLQRTVHAIKELGVKAGNAADIIAAGATVLVAGSDIFEGDVAENVVAWRTVMAQADGDALFQLNREVGGPACAA
jgi:pentose-5-phosphate-3-epimerase